MYRLTRITTAPASPLKIMIAKPDGPDAGLTAGGSYVIEPGDQIQVDAYVAGIIMGDPSLARHFESLPAWPAATPADPDPASPDPVIPVPAEPALFADQAPDAEAGPSKWEPTPRRRGR